MYSGSDGTFHYADVGAGNDRMTISSTGALNVNGTLTATGLALIASSGGEGRDLWIHVRTLMDYLEVER